MAWSGSGLIGDPYYNQIVPISWTFSSGTL